MLQQRVLRQVDCEMMDNLPLTANETASEMVLLENAHVDCALYVCNQNTPPPHVIERVTARHGRIVVGGFVETAQPLVFHRNRVLSHTGL